MFAEISAVTCDGAPPSYLLKRLNVSETVSLRQQPLMHPAAAQLSHHSGRLIAPIRLATGTSTRFNEQYEDPSTL